MYEKRKVSLWVPIAIVIVLISLIVVYMSSQENMNVYKGETNPLNTTTSVKTEIDLSINKHELIKLSYGVPKDWTKVIKDGALTYIHTPSTSSFQIRVKEYIPDLLTINQNYVMGQLNANGMSLINFKWNSNSSFLILYQKGMDEKATYYIDSVDFDQNHYVWISYTFPAKYYDRIMPIITAIIDSVKWDKEKPYPQDVSMIYNGNAHVEFSFPTAWTSGIQDNVLFAQDPQTGTSLSYVVNSSTVTYGNITQLDYLNWASAGRTNFALQTFECTPEKLKAVSTYHANNQSMVLVQYMFATGSFEYIITFDIPQNSYKTQQKLIDTLVTLVRIYPAENKEA